MLRYQIFTPRFHFVRENLLFREAHGARPACREAASRCIRLGGGLGWPESHGDQQHSSKWRQHELSQRALLKTHRRAGWHSTLLRSGLGSHKATGQPAALESRAERLHGRPFRVRAAPQAKRLAALRLIFAPSEPRILASLRSTLGRALRLFRLDLRRSGRSRAWLSRITRSWPRGPRGCAAIRAWSWPLHERP